MLQLLPAPPPPPEYCLLWADRWWPWSDPWWLCMQKAEWSGWAQFTGAMLAVIVAICIPLLNERGAKKRDFHWAQAVIIGLGSAVRECVEACETQNLVTLHAARGQLQRAVDECGSLQFSSLTHESWGAIVGCRNICSDLLMRTDGMTFGANWQHWRASFDAVGHGIGAVGRTHFKLT